MVALLGEFIQDTSDVREQKRALAVRRAIEGKSYEEMAEWWGVYKSFITRWKQEFYEQGIEGLNWVIGVGKVTCQKQKDRR